jgi:hypothetical protein
MYVCHSSLASVSVGMSEKLLKAKKEIESEIFVCTNTRESVSHSDGKFQVANLLPHSNLNPSSRRRLRMRSATYKRERRHIGGNKK